MEIYSNKNKLSVADNNYIIANNNKILIGILLGVGILVGLCYWAIHKDNVLYKVSIDYQQLIDMLTKSKPKTLEAIAKFADKNKNTYGALASLNLAKKYIDQDELAEAIKWLQIGIKSTNDTNLQAIINLRLARIQLQQKHISNALETLDRVKGKGWTTVVEDIRGEVLLSNGDSLGARKAWNRGITDESSPILKAIMQIKINNLD